MTAIVSKIRRTIARLWLVAAPLLFTSCIDSREEVWIHADGSGRAELELSLPAATVLLGGGEEGVRNMIREFFEKTPQLKNPVSSVKIQGKQLNILIAASFDSISDLTEITTGDALAALPSSADAMAGTTEVTVSGRTFELVRTVAAGKLPGTLFMPASQVKGRRLLYVIHLPKPAHASNATRTENDGRTLIWEKPLGQAIRKPFTIEFKAEIPMPRWLIVSATAAAAALAAVALLVVRWVLAKLKNRVIPHG